MKTQRQKIEKWVDREGWKHTERAYNDTMGSLMGRLLLSIVVFGVIILVVGLLTGDPFSDWVYVEDAGDDVVPWFEELLVTGFAAIGSVFSALGVHAALIKRDSTWTDCFGSYNTGLKAYKMLDKNEQSRLKQPLLDYLEICANDQERTPAGKKHEEAWYDLHAELLNRDRLLADSRAVAAGDEVVQYAETVRNEISQLKKEAHNELH